MTSIVMSSQDDDSTTVQLQRHSPLVALVTGGNRGIGLEIVRQLAEQHPQWIVCMGCRSLEKGEAALSTLRSSASAPNGHTDANNAAATLSYTNVRLLELDVTSATSIAAATAHLSSVYGRLDVLICNAGVMLRKPPSVAELVMHTNLYSVHELLQAMDALLVSSGRHWSQPPLVVVVSSEVGPWVVHQLRGVLRQRVEQAAEQGSWAELADCAADYVRFLAQPASAQYQWPPPQSTVYAYGVSKALVTAFVRLYAQQHPHVTAVCSCPGYCSTDMTAGAVGVEKRSAAAGAESVLWAVEHREELGSGRMYQDGVELPVAQARRRRQRRPSTQQHS